MSNYETLSPTRLKRDSGWNGEVTLLETTVSTQEEAKQMAEKGAPEGTAVIAEEQTGGRGRMGRKWHSPKGKGIWMSVVLRPRLTLQATPQLTLLAGVAVCRAIRTATGVEAGIKWPNDLLVSGRKVCGILLESSMSEGQLQYCIAGIGIDANLAEDDYPDFLQGVGSSLMMERGGIPVDRTELAASVLAELESLYKLYLEHGFGPIGMLWESLSVTLGRQIGLNTAGGRTFGKAVGLDNDGGLLLENDEGRIFSVCSGEIELF